MGVLAMQTPGNGSSSDGSRTRLAALAKLAISPEATRILPVDFVKKHRVLPLAIHNGTIDVATAGPGNERVIEDIRLLSGLEVQEFEAPAAEIAEKIAECYQVTVEKMIESLNPAQEPVV
jgi:type IV pilus assembly protein PilB